MKQHSNGGGICLQRRQRMRFRGCFRVLLKCQRFKKNLLWLLLLTTSVSSVVVWLILTIVVNCEMKSDLNSSVIAAECLCVFESIEYDFCYHLPENRTIKGIRFNCSIAPILYQLNLLLSDGKRKNVSDRKKNWNGYLELNSKLEITDAVIVTACTEDHWAETKRLIASIRQYWPASSKRIIVYDLGLASGTVEFIRNITSVRKSSGILESGDNNNNNNSNGNEGIDRKYDNNNDNYHNCNGVLCGDCNLEYRLFDWEKYPKFVKKKMGDFRWKPLIIAEMLKEYQAIWYVDSSVIFKNNHSNGVMERLLKCFSDLSVETKNVNDSKANIVFTKQNSDATDDLSQQQKSRIRSNGECLISTYLLHAYTGHGIYAATDPETYRFIPTNLEKLKKPTAKMYEAGLALVLRTTGTMESVLRWYVSCALDEACMGTRRPYIYCDFYGKNRFSEFANCHRFDQSILNLLLANLYSYDYRYYSSGMVDFFNITRGV